MFTFQQETSSGSTDPSSIVLMKEYHFDRNVKEILLKYIKELI